MMKYFALFLASTALTSAADFVTGQAARLTIGQRTFTAGEQGASGQLLGAVGGVAYANNRLFVVDGSRVGAIPVNNRVLIYQNILGSLFDPKAPIPPAVNTGIRCPVCVGSADFVLGQIDFTSTDINLTQAGLRTPTAVASDGQRLVVSDTDNSRVLIWNNIPAGNGVPADLVLGQKDFTSIQSPPQTTASSLRGPQGLWIQNNKLYVADTQNNRVMIWNTFPTTNNQPADVVLGVANFTTAPQLDLTKAGATVAATTLLNPVSVTTDGTHLFVTDLGNNRVLIWNSIPTQNQQPADIVLGQPDMVSNVANNTTKLCASGGNDATSGNPVYPFRCAGTLSFPRFALSDGKRLFVADGGNDRVLVYENIPPSNGYFADRILGQPDDLSDIVTDTSDTTFDPNIRQSSPGTIRTPLSLAYDGTNLFVADPYDRRVLVFSAGENFVPNDGVRNAASLEVFSFGSVVLGGTIKTGDTVTITINTTAYKYTIVDKDTFDTIATGLVALINANAGDPNAVARANIGFNSITLTSRLPGSVGNSITLTVTLSTSAVITANAASFAGGEDAARLAPGALVTIVGQNLSSGTASADPAVNTYPDTLAGTQVYFDGIRAPLIFVSPTQINAQIPYELFDATSTSLYVRSTLPDGTTNVSVAIDVPIVPQNPGIFAGFGPDPRPGVALHGSTFATGSVSVDGSITAANTATITIEDRSYTYTIVATDTTTSVRDGLIALINANPEEKVVASAATQFVRVVLTAKIPGPEGNGISYSGTIAPVATATILITPTNTRLCCANVAGSLITTANPAVVGETIIVYATGLGLVSPDEAKNSAITGIKYFGPVQNQPYSTVFALAGGFTANVLSAGLKPGTIGVHEVRLELGSGMTPDQNTQLTIAQDIYTSNIIVIPVVAPNP